MDVETYAKHIQFRVDDLTDLLLETLSDADWRTLLDLGCGDGATLYALDQRGLLAGKEVYGVDLSESRIALAQEINPSFTCIVDDACHLAHISADSIDLLLSNMVIEHVPDDEVMVSQIGKVLRPGGTAYISTVFKKWYGWYFYRCNGRWTIDPTHIREYTDDAQLLPLFRRHGLVVSASKKTPVRFPLTDFIIRRTTADRNVYAKNNALRAMRRVRVPVPGYSTTPGRSCASGSRHPRRTLLRRFAGQPSHLYECALPLKAHRPHRLIKRRIPIRRFQTDTPPDCQVFQAMLHKRRCCLGLINPWVEQKHESWRAKRDGVYPQASNQAPPIRHHPPDPLPAVEGIP